MTMPMLSRNAFATNSLKQTFVWDAWFYSQIVCSKTQSTPSNSNSIIDLFLKNVPYFCWLLLKSKQVL